MLLASPSNPTGTSIAPDELRRIHEVVSQRGGITLIDEIYLGLSYDDAFGQTALAIDDNVISINSFSKYFNMTGWRLGWLVVPEALVPVVERLAQNLFICASTVSQYAALACFEAESIAEYERRRAEFKARRDWFIPQLNALGLERAGGARRRLLRLGRLHELRREARHLRQLGLRLRDHEARPRRGHARPRLRHSRDRPASSASPPPVRWRTCEESIDRLRAMAENRRPQ